MKNSDLVPAYVARHVDSNHTKSEAGKSLRVWFFSLFVIAGAILVSSTAFAKAPPASFADLAAKLLPAVVNISTTQAVKRDGATKQQRPQLPPGSPFEEFFKEFFDRQQQRNTPNRRATSLGSGFIIDPSGLVVTNNHVIEGADEISVILQDDTRLKAELVGRDAKTDLAILRVKSKKKLPYVKFGNSDKSRVGDWVVAIGNPFGLGGTVTAGIISARARNINAGPYDDFIQSDASINKGNSGGPMFNMAGEVIGINTAIYSPSGGSVGIGFAIPANLAKPIIAQLTKFGRARRGWLGVRIQTVTEELADSLGLDKARGALVADVTKDGPAESSKIQVGDVILSFDGKPIVEMRNLPRIVAETEVGKDVKVDVWRKGRKVTLDAKLGEFPEDKKPVLAKASSKKTADGKSVTVLGLTMAPVTDELRRRFKLGKKAEGVIITKVANDSPASEKHIRAGSIIRKIGPEQKQVESPAQVKDKVESARKAKLKSLLFLIERGGDSRFVALRLSKAKS
ncbi:MAG: Do family serine endopeptidase [Alphaproteobacteria bacterium]|nr:Do family serine endopeptidase [Alphaproteobacteria bacterium]